ncbi:hypothetical protein [Mesorhizobium sp. M0586]|uniref:hypothetical protein n=1 Tax=unclassified Mesorhizobium TaxID=325217 RepID=UPI00333D1E6F
MSTAQWLNDLISKVAKEETVDFISTPPLTVGGRDPEFRSLVPEETYLSVRVKSLRLPLRRRGVAKLHGVVHTFANLPGAGQEATEFASATTPTALFGLDPKNVSNILMIDRQVVGPTPWRGGDLRLQIGLFSVVEQDLAGPFLLTMTALSDKVGVAFVTPSKPFIEVISSAVGALTRQVGSVKLEIGMDRTFQVPKPGHYALIASSVGELAGAKMDLDPDDGKLKVDGQHYEDRPYLVFTIEAVEKQARWGEIGELRDAYRLVNEAVRANDQSKVRDAMTSFRLLTMSSPDLIATDASDLIKKVDAKLRLIFSSPVVSSKDMSQPLPSFEELGLYK